MKRLLLLAALTLSGCTAGQVVTPDPARVDLAVNGAVIAEAGTRLRCPRSNAEWQAVRGIRLAFDLRYGGLLSSEQFDRLNDARRLTDATCA